MRSPMHFDEERVQRFLHGELTPPDAASARDHLAACAECRSRVGESEREEAWLFGLLRRLDHPAPRVSVETITARRLERGPGWGRWAAAALLASVLAGVAYAAPGSPLPRVVGRLMEWAWREPPLMQPRESSLPTPPIARGIAVAPGGRFTIDFSFAQTTGAATVTLTSGTEVVVRALDDSATFASEADGLSITNSGSSTRFEIEIPRGAPWVDVRVGGRRIFLKDAARVITNAPRDAVGRYRLPLVLPDQ